MSYTPYVATVVLGESGAKMANINKIFSNCGVKLWDSWISRECVGDIFRGNRDRTVIGRQIDKTGLLMYK